jgi:all-trans-retinol dehydrogenase (NAD+)
MVLDHVRGVVYSFIASFLQWRQDSPKFSLFALLILFGVFVQKLRSFFKKPKNLRGKVVLITGGASGIGRLTAISMKKKGAIVIIWDINEDGLREMQTHIDLSMKCDITSKDEVMQAAAEVLSKYQVVDILINNAGIVIGKPILQLEERHIRKTFDVNIIAHFFTIQAFLPKMIEQKSGHLVTIASTAGYIGVSHLTDYCATKFAARGLHDAVMHELQDLGVATGIHTTCINPYMVNTGMFDGAIDSKTWFIRKIAGCEMLEPEYVASEIIRAIQYNIRDLVLPAKLSLMILFEHNMTDWMKDFLLSQGPCMKHLTGRVPTPKKKNKSLTSEAER